MDGYVVLVSKDFKTVGVYEDIVLELGLRFTWSGDERSLASTIKGENPSLLILDLELDDKPNWGLNFCKKLKANDVFSKVPVLIRSKIVNEEVYAMVIEAGAVGLLPVDYPPHKIKKTLTGLSMVISSSVDQKKEEETHFDVSDDQVEEELKDVAKSDVPFEEPEDLDPETYSDFVKNLTVEEEDPEDLLEDSLIDYGQNYETVKEYLATVLYNIRESGHLDDDNLDIGELILSYTKAVVDENKKI